MNRPFDVARIIDEANTINLDGVFQALQEPVGGHSLVLSTGSSSISIPGIQRPPQRILNRVPIPIGTRGRVVWVIVEYRRLKGRRHGRRD